jgi:hypothetical protein
MQLVYSVWHLPGRTHERLIAHDTWVRIDGLQTFGGNAVDLATLL